MVIPAPTDAPKFSSSLRAAPQRQWHAARCVPSWALQAARYVPNAAVSAAFCSFTQQACWLLNKELSIYPSPYFLCLCSAPPPIYQVAAQLSKPWSVRAISPVPLISWVITGAVWQHTVTQSCGNSCLLLSRCFCASVLCIVIIKAGRTGIYY